MDADEFLINEAGVSKKVTAALIKSYTAILIGGAIGNSPAVGSMLHVGTGGVLAQDNPNLFWDAVNKRLGIRTSAPAWALDIPDSTTTRFFYGGGSPVIHRTGDFFYTSPAMEFYRARGTIAAPTLPNIDDIIGDFNFRVWDGSSYSMSASFGAVQETAGGGGRLVFRTDPAPVVPSTDRAFISARGNFVIGAPTATAQLATTATDGFFHISSSAGAPTGTPTVYAGRVPIHVDTTNGRLYSYFGGAWAMLSPQGANAYRTILESSGSHTAARAAGTYALGQGDPIAISGTGTLYPINTIYIDSADYPTIAGLTTKMRIRAQLYVNDISPTGNYTFGLYPITRPATSGAAGLNIYTLGTVVAGSTGATFTAPAADAQLNAASADFAIPANGHYVIGVVATAAVAASSHLHISASLQMRNT